MLALQTGGQIGNVVVSTLALSVAVGGILMVVARKARIPGIVLLLGGGVLMGPEGLGLVQPETLGPSLNVLVAVAVGLILFEGGLTLDLNGYRSAPRVIRNLLSIGVLVTWITTALFIWLLFPVDPAFAALAGSLIIVTGPTVIQPILKRIRLKWNLHNILHWEGVLNDPIGVFLAILAFEVVVGGAGETALLHLFLRIFGGLLIGYLGGEAIARLLKSRFVPEEMTNVFVVAAAMLVFGVTEALVAEGGLLSVTVAGLVCGTRRPPALKGIVEFKSILIDLLIGFVFILLVARLEFAQFVAFWPMGFVLVGLVVFVVRPLMVWVCTRGAGLGVADLFFLSWVAPRGVVAASMASLFALTLAEQGRFENPEFLESFVYSLIFVTVLLQGFSAAPLARLLGLMEKEPDGWLIVGAHPIAREVARFMREVRQVPVLLVDGNRVAVREAVDEGLTAIYGDARETASVEDIPEMQGIGKLLAFTDNEDLNELLCKKWEPQFGATHVYRWASIPSKPNDIHNTGVVLWSWMPKPSMISSELMLGEAATVRRSGPRIQRPGTFAALLTGHSAEVLLDPKPESEITDSSVPSETLYLQREADYLLNALSEEWTMISHGMTARAVYGDLAERLAMEFEHLSGEALLRQVMDREEAAPTGLGHGVALPHARVEGPDRTLCAIALVPSGLSDFAGIDEPVRLVFMLISPPDKPEMHLAVLGEIARLCADANIRQQLMQCQTVTELLALIRRYRRQHTPFADVRG
jgi:NhaP-type Na+/H+ or K+/H+ antiporter/mannitol/fructose-specific phosphotransferase system IIA component (Ntr-type)